MGASLDEARYCHTTAATPFWLSWGAAEAEEAVAAAGADGLESLNRDSSSSSSLSSGASPALSFVILPLALQTSADDNFLPVL